MNPLLNLRAYIALLVVYLVWGTTLGAMRIGVETIPPVLLACVRYLLAGSLLLGFCLMRGEALPSRRDCFIHLLVGFMLFVVGNALSCWAVQFIPTGLAGMMVATAPFWMVAINGLFPPRERVKPLALVGILIGFMGIALLFWPSMSASTGSLSVMFWPAVGVMLFTAIMWSGGSILARRKTVSTSLLMSVSLQNLWAGVILLPLCLFGGLDYASLAPTAASIGALWYLVLFATIVATPCYLYVLKALPVSVSSTFAFVAPMLTVFFGWQFLHESLTSTMLAGCGVIFCGVAVVQCANRVRLLPKGALS